MGDGIAAVAETGTAFPWLSLIVLLPAASALLLPLLPAEDNQPSPWPRNVAFGVLLVDLLLMMGVLATRFDPTQSGLQLVERVSWVPSIGLEWSLGVDGLSAPLVVLSGLVTLLSVWASWTIERKSRLYFALLLVQASAQGLVFLSQDFLLFFLAWELELVPCLFAYCDLGRSEPSIRCDQIHPLHRRCVPADLDQWPRSSAIGGCVHAESE
jgi:NAD(P)H-quinone oxidoreductase subunit 4